MPNVLQRAAEEALGGPLPEDRLFNAPVMDESQFGRRSSLSPDAMVESRRLDDEMVRQERIAHMERMKYQRNVVESDLFARDSIIRREEMDRAAASFQSGDRVMESLRASRPSSPDEYNAIFERLLLDEPDAMLDPRVQSVFRHQLAQYERDMRERERERIQQNEERFKHYIGMKSAAYEAMAGDEGLRTRFRQRQEELMAPDPVTGLPTMNQADATEAAAFEIKAIRADRAAYSAISQMFGLTDREIRELIADEVVDAADIESGGLDPDLTQQARAEALRNPPQMDEDLARRVMIRASRKVGMMPDGRGGFAHPRPVAEPRADRPRTRAQILSDIDAIEQRADEYLTPEEKDQAIEELKQELRTASLGAEAADPFNRLLQDSGIDSPGASNVPDLGDLNLVPDEEAEGD